MVPRERVQRIDEQIVIPQITDDIVEEFKIVPQEQFLGKDL